MKPNAVSAIGFTEALPFLLWISPLSAQTNQPSGANSSPGTSSTHSCPPGTHWEEAGYVHDGKWRDAGCAKDGGREIPLNKSGFE
jgi:hypothetical protein